MRHLLFLLLPLLLMAAFCNNSDPKMDKQRQVIEQAQEIELFEVEDYPTAPKEQVKISSYLADYRVLKKIEISPQVQKDLQTAALDTQNYILDEKKTCPFEGRYALRFTNQKEQVVLVLSARNCPKVIIASNQKKVDKLYYDLKADNRIQDLIAQIGGYNDAPKNDAQQQEEDLPSIDDLDPIDNSQPDSTGVGEE
jgi:hypothetical protein